MDLSIIIINYKTKQVTADCLVSIKKSTDKLTKEVLVIDNGSADGSIEYLKKKFNESLFDVSAHGENNVTKYDIKIN